MVRRSGQGARPIRPAGRLRPGRRAAPIGRSGEARPAVTDPHHISPGAPAMDDEPRSHAITFTYDHGPLTVFGEGPAAEHLRGSQQRGAGRPAPRPGRWAEDDFGPGCR